MTAPEIITKILIQLHMMAVKGVARIDIDRKAEELLKKYKCKSYNKGYIPAWALKPYPAVCCINTNCMIAHGIPGEDVLSEGDIVSIDLGIIDRDGNCADAATSFGIGEITNEKKRLLYYAYQTMMEGINAMRVGENTETIAHKIETYAAQRGYRVNKRFGGHSIGKEMHMDPKIYNTVEPSHKYSVLKEGQVFCIEPMVTSGRDNIGQLMGDGWTYITADAKPSTFFENMVKITKDGPEILTHHIIPPTL